MPGGESQVLGALSSDVRRGNGGTRCRGTGEGGGLDRAAGSGENVHMRMVDGENH